MAQQILFSRLGELFGPGSNLSANNLKDKWRVIPYRTGGIEGTMLASLTDGMPEDVTFDPRLTGWYKIYVCVPTMTELEIQLKLTGDEGFFKIYSQLGEGLTCTQLEESFWRYARMDGKTITVSGKAISHVPGKPSCLAWLRFEEMTPEEVDTLMADRARQDTKRLYLTDDIHNRLYYDLPDAHPDFWDGVVLPYEDSDAEWLSLEQIDLFISGSCPGNDPDSCAFMRAGDRLLQKQREDFDSLAVLGSLVKKGQAKGMQMSLSLRMGAWGIGFPFDQCYFDYDYYLENPQWRCVMREGTPAAAFSYAFPEVQQLMIGKLLAMAATGCDAVTLIAHRGIPYVLYEEPVVKQFRELYGEDPRDLPLDDPRLNDLHCQIMTGFFRKLRQALDAAHPHRHVQVHLRSLASLYDSRYVGLDCDVLAKEGLVDAIISYPVRYREIYGEGCILPNGRIDMARYTAYVNDPSGKPYLHQGDRACFDPFPDSQGILRGPATVAQCVQEWMELEHKYGVKIYIDILPRIMPPQELRRRTLELYDAGAERFALWDTYGRVPVKAMWGTARYLGHKELLEQDLTPQPKYYRIHELAGNDISRYLPIWGG